MYRENKVRYCKSRRKKTNDAENTGITIINN